MVTSDTESKSSKAGSSLQVHCSNSLGIVHTSLFPVFKLSIFTSNKSKLFHTKSFPLCLFPNSQLPLLIHFVRGLEMHKERKNLLFSFLIKLYFVTFYAENLNFFMFWYINNHDYATNMQISLCCDLVTFCLCFKYFWPLKELGKLTWMHVFQYIIPKQLFNIQH